MNKQHFFMKLHPPRPTFAQDMTSEEKEIMNAHIVYWNKFLQDGSLIVFGPVLDPAGAFGIGVFAADNEAHAWDIVNNDPASAIGRYDLFPMHAVTASAAT